MAEGPPETLAGRDRMLARVRFRVADAAGMPDLGQSPTANGGYELRADDPTQALHRLTGWAQERGLALEGLEVDRPSLEDVYLDLTGGEEAVVG